MNLEIMTLWSVNAGPYSLTKHLIYSYIKAQPIRVIFRLLKKGPNATNHELIYARNYIEEVQKKTRNIHYDKAIKPNAPFYSSLNRECEVGYFSNVWLWMILMCARRQHLRQQTINNNTNDFEKLTGKCGNFSRAQNVHIPAHKCTFACVSIYNRFSVRIRCCGILYNRRFMRQYCEN